MWRFFHANTSYHAMTLTFDPLTLKVCGRSGGTLSLSVLNSIEIEQLPAELFTIWQIFAHVTSRCDLDLWPLDFELLWYFGRRVSKPCVKFEWNRTIRGRVIHDLAHFRRQIFDRSPNPRIDLRGAWTELHQTCRGHKGIIAELRYCFLTSDILLRFQTRAAQNRAMLKTMPNLAFLTPVKIRGGVGELSGSIIVALPRTEPRV